MKSWDDPILDKDQFELISEWVNESFVSTMQLTLTYKPANLRIKRQLTRAEVLTNCQPNGARNALIVRMTKELNDTAKGLVGWYQI